MSRFTHSSGKFSYLLKSGLCKRFDKYHVWSDCQLFSLRILELASLFVEHKPQSAPLADSEMSLQLGEESETANAITYNLNAKDKTNQSITQKTIYGKKREIACSHNPLKEQLGPTNIFPFKMEI